MLKFHALNNTSPALNNASSNIVIHNLHNNSTAGAAGATPSAAAVATPNASAMPINATPTTAGGTQSSSTRNGGSGPDAIMIKNATSSETS